MTLNLSELEGEVESDEVYITAGSKGNNGSRPVYRAPRKRGLKKRGRGTYDTDKVPILGLVQRGGDVHFSVVRNVQTKTIKPIMEKLIASNTTIYTDEYNIYNFLDQTSDYKHISVCHSKGKYAIDIDGDGICEAHVNTQEGAWSLLRPWIRPHRRINKMYLPLYVALAEFFYNYRRNTPAKQIRTIIDNATSLIGYFLKELYKIKKLLPSCSV